jgi:uncharacterized protein YerC
LRWTRLTIGSVHPDAPVYRLTRSLKKAVQTALISRVVRGFQRGSATLTATLREMQVTETAGREE